MYLDSVKKYLNASVKTPPYFLFIGDGQYETAQEELRVMGLDPLPMSSFCSGEDKMPDIDGFLTSIKAAGLSAEGKKLAVTGLGEFLGLRGRVEAEHILLRLKDFNIGGAKVVLLLRGLASLSEWLENSIKTGFERYQMCVIDKAECDLSFTLAAPPVGLPALPGFKAMLAELEKGRCGIVAVNTAVNLDKALFTVRQISNAYEAIQFSTRNFALARSCGSDACWAELLTELNQSGGSLDAVFEKHGFGDNPVSDFSARVPGNDYRSWLYFIYLKSKVHTLQNGYLRFVLDKTNRFEDFAGTILKGIIEIPHTDKRFAVFYQERKALAEKFPESDIANFLVDNRRILSESIYKLTDNTKKEKEEIITWVSQNGITQRVAEVYPDFAAYLKRYIFKGSDLADLLTDYFESYKRQKIANKIEDDFLNTVDELAKSRVFNRLSSRNQILEQFESSDAFLYWLDALGVEYLAFIESLAQEKGLSISVHIARAELPTITSVNRDFYEIWPDTMKYCNKELDEIKHKEKGGYNFLTHELPIHLARELDIIKGVIEKAATDLGMYRYKRFLLASDHGASRLAVLRRKDEKYETDTKGEHSGRCCKLFQPYDLPFAAEEGGYLVLADYGRFKGSRSANVEVHGGASLEEVIVPIIELTLKNSTITVTLVEDEVTVDYRTGTEITLFFNAPVQDVSVVLNGKPYSASPIDANHYSVNLSDAKRAGGYPADVYAGDNLIGTIMIKAQGKSGKINDAFDGLF